MLYKAVSNDQDTIDFQADVDLVANWAKLNHLELNSHKSKLMYITRSHVSQCPSILLHGVRLDQVHHYKYLRGMVVR